MTWKRLGIISAVVAILFVIPFTRQALLFILPLGEGIDDIIAFVAILLSCLIWGWIWISGLKRDTQRILSDEDHMPRIKEVHIPLLDVDIDNIIPSSEDYLKLLKLEANAKIAIVFFSIIGLALFLILIMVWFITLILGGQQ